jgi:hypothetical protein
MRAASTLLLAAMICGAAPATAQVAAAAAKVVATPYTAEETARYMALGKQASRLFFEGQADSLAAMMTEAEATDKGGADGLRRLMDQVAEIGGMVLEVLEEKVVHRGAAAEFWWEADFSEFTAESVVFRWAFNDAGQITGFDANPKSQTPPPDPEG